MARTARKNRRPYHDPARKGACLTHDAPRLITAEPSSRVVMLRWSPNFQRKIFSRQRAPSGLYDFVSDRVPYELGNRTEMKFAHDGGAMGLHGCHGQSKEARDLFVRFPFG